MNTLYTATTTHSPPTAQVSQLKRTRDVEGGDAHDVTPPPLPQISTDLTLQVFTDPSLRRPQELYRNPADAEQDDNERLSILGQTVFSTTLTEILFRRRPHFLAEDISTVRNSVMHGGIIDKWIASYQLQTKLRSAPNVTMSKQKESDKHAVFYSYVGAVFLTSGAGAVDNWIRRLLSQESDMPDLSLGITGTGAASDPPPPKRVKSEASSPKIPPSSVATPTTSQPGGLPMYHQTAHQLQMQLLQGSRQQQHWQQPVKPPSYQPSYSSFALPSQQSFAQQSIRQPPPHVGMQPQAVSGSSHVASPPPPAAANRTNPLSPAQPNLAFLPLFNQRAVQRRVTVEYVPSFSGPPHAGQWTVQCVVNGIIKGVGHGSSKQLAKEEAARQAYYSMGWT